MQEFHVEDATQSNLPTSVFLIGYIVGPLAFSPLSETVGRRLVLLPTITVFTLSTVACALSPNWGSLLFFRFICGTMGSAPQTVVGGVYADMFFDLRERGRVMAFYMAVCLWWFVQLNGCVSADCASSQLVSDPFLVQLYRGLHLPRMAGDGHSGLLPSLRAVLGSAFSLCLRPSGRFCQDAMHLDWGIQFQRTLSTLFRLSSDLWPCCSSSPLSPSLRYISRWLTVLSSFIFKLIQLFLTVCLLFSWLHYAC